MAANLNTGSPQGLPTLRLIQGGGRCKAPTARTYSDNFRQEVLRRAPGIIKKADERRGLPRDTAETPSGQPLCARGCGACYLSCRARLAGAAWWGERLTDILSGIASERPAFRVIEGGRA